MFSGELFPSSIHSNLVSFTEPHELKACLQHLVFFLQVFRVGSFKLCSLKLCQGRVNHRIIDVLVSPSNSMTCGRLRVFAYSVVAFQCLKLCICICLKRSFCRVCASCFLKTARAFLCALVRVRNEIEELLPRLRVPASTSLNVKASRYRTVIVYYTNENQFSFLCCAFES